MEAVGELTGGVAHDFNNILTVITGTIEILQEAVADRPELVAVATMIDDAASCGADLTQSGGHIKIYSEEGHGTTIRLYLPPAEEQHASLDALPAVPVQGGSEIVLAVEDDPLVRTHVVTQLRSLGYQVLVAANAAEALVMIESDARIDVLFTDVIMPGMNGRQLAEAARKRRPDLKVLFTSGYTENAIVHHGRLDPGVLLLTKPYRKADLARMMRQAVGENDRHG
jgi:CheY-like chemotaxis protein